VTAKALAHLQEELADYVPAERILTLQTELTTFRDHNSGTVVAPASLTDKRFVAFSGLGNPTSFGALLRKAGMELTAELDFADHYRYTEQDVAALLKRIEGQDATHLITTAKDAVKLPGESFPPNACLVAEIQLVFGDGADIFESKIREVAGC